MMQALLNKIALGVGFLLLGALPALAQEILLDKSVDCGELTCFQSYDDPLTFYYLPDKPRLATDAGGRPQFSFLKYVTNEAKGGEAGITEAEGGGIVHFLVTYGPSPTQVSFAESDLQREVPGARLAGPIMYRSGTFTLVSSFKQENGDFTNEVIGLGKAPLIEGHKAAVSMNLTKKGAQILWESFKTATPDISIVFEMEFAGYREPYAAHLEADWSMFSKHQNFAAGAKIYWFGADIQATFDELRQSGGIKITTKGENVLMDKIIASAYSKLQDIIFEKDSSQQAVKSLKQQGNYDNLMQAVNFIKSQGTAQKRSRYQQEHPWHYAMLAVDWPTTDGGPWLMAAVAQAAEQKDDPAGDAHLKPRYQEATTLYQAQKYKEAIAIFQEVLAAAKTAKVIQAMYWNMAACYQKLGQYNDVVVSLERFIASKPTAAEIEEARKKITEAKAKLAGASGATTPQPAAAAPQKSSTPPAKASSAKKPVPARKPAAAAKKTMTMPQTSPFSMVASYRLKTVKRSGKFSMDFNQYVEAKQAAAFAENIGNLWQRYGKDPLVFKAVNIDDAVYKQREILASLDGQDSADFDKYVNYVTIQLRKQHENGELTVDEVVIDKKNFNGAGNNFRLLYGWKGDDDRQQWLNYQYRIDWSFHGGLNYEGKWLDTDSVMINAAPPYEYRRLTLEADPKVFRGRQVRHATIRIYYPFLGRTEMKQATIKTNRDLFSIPLDYIHTRGKLDYEYEIAWHLAGGKEVSSGRRQAGSDILYCDEIPNIE